MRFKSQGAIFDSLIFLLIASITSSLMLYAASSFGDTVFRMIESSYILLFIQNAHKSMYFIDVGNLTDENVIINGNLYSCNDLNNFKGEGSPYRCLKEDLFDGKLDLRGGSCGVNSTLALKCGFEKVLRPLVQGGYIYVIELENKTGGNLLEPYGGLSNGDYRECDDINTDKISVIFPFRVLIPENYDIDNYLERFRHGIEDYKIRICVTSKIS